MIKITKTTTVEEIFKCWLNDYEKFNLKPGSFDRKENTCRWQVYPHIGSKSAKSLSIDDVEFMIDQLRVSGYSYSTIKKAFEAVASCYRFYRQHHKLTNNPTDGIKVPSGGKKRVNKICFYTYEQLQIIQRECQRIYKNGGCVYPSGDLIIILANTGMRAGELLALTWSDVDLRRRIISVNKNAVRVKNRTPDAKTQYSHIIQDSTKTSSSIRSVPINDTAYDAFQRLSQSKGKRGFVCKTKAGSLLTLQNFRRAFDRILKNSGFPPEYWYGLHALRHTFATNLISKGADIKKVSEILGHSSVSITYDYYVHFIPRDLQATVNLLDNRKSDVQN